VASLMGLDPIPIEAVARLAATNRSDRLSRSDAMEGPPGKRLARADTKAIGEPQSADGGLIEFISSW